MRTVVSSPPHRFRRLQWCCLGLLSLGTLAACGDSREWQNVKRETGEAWDAAKAWGAAKRTDAERVFTSSVDGLSQSYQTTKAKVKDSETAKALDAHLDNVNEKFKALKEASADEWEKARDAFVAAYEAAQREVKRTPATK